MNYRYIERKQIVDIDFVKSGNILSLKIMGRIGEAEADTLKIRFRENKLDNIDEVIIDMAEVSHLGSSGIGKLILIYKDVSLKNGTLRIINAPEHIFKLLKSLKFDQIFSISNKAS